MYLGFFFYIGTYEVYYFIFISDDDVLGIVIMNQLKLEGFIVSRWLSAWPVASQQLVQWIKEVSSEIKYN